MKILLFLLLISSFACRQTTVVKKEEVKPMSPLEYTEKMDKWLKVSDEYLKKQLYYLGRNDMTPEDHANFNEYSVLSKMAIDSAQYYSNMRKGLERADTLKAVNKWLKKYFVDEFGDKTSRAYISQRCFGSFSNSAVEGSKLIADVRFYYSDSDLISQFDLAEYSHAPKVSSKGGVLSIKTSSEQTNIFMLGSGLTMNISKDNVDEFKYFQNPKLFLNIMKKETTTIKILIRTLDDSNYNFKVDPQGFNESLKSLVIK